MRRPVLKQYVITRQHSQPRWTLDKPGKTHQKLAVKDGSRVSDCLHTSLYNKICLWFTVFLSFNSTDQFVDVPQLSLSPLFQLPTSNWKHCIKFKTSEFKLNNAKTCFFFFFLDGDWINLGMKIWALNTGCCQSDWKAFSWWSDRTKTARRRIWYF